MGGGFMLSGNSAFSAAATPPFSSTGNSEAPYAICSSSKPSSQNIGDFVFGSAPSRPEVERAILDLQRFMHSFPSPKSELDGLHGLLHHDDESILMVQNPGFVKFCDSFYMMQTEPSLQNVVISISCDQAFWEAILSNNAVQDLRGSVSTAKEEKSLSNTNEEQDIAILVLRWIMGFTKSKVLELVGKVLFLVNEIVDTKEKPSTSDVTDLLEEKVRSSLLLSVVIVLIVVVTRNQG